MKKKICFIILHYGENKEITRQAVLSVRKLSFDGVIDIVVVCNGKQYDISEEMKPYADVLVLEENSGFSKGNNVGYAYAKEKDDYDFMIIMNNDVFIEQTDFIRKLYSLYENCPFFVAGPDIFVPYSKRHTNPMRSDLCTIKDVVDSIRKMENTQKDLSKTISGKGIKMYLRESYQNRAKLSFLFQLNRILKPAKINYSGLQENVVLHGPCIIFSKDFIRENEKAFVPEVFLYNEEDYLAWRCYDNNWKMIYSDDLRVMHYHHASTGLLGLSYREYCDRRIDNLNVRINAARQLKQYLENREKNN